MDARGRGPPVYGGRSAQAPGIMRYGSYPVGHSVEPLHPERADSKLVAQSIEMQRLTLENQRLAASHVGLRQDLAGTQQDSQKLKAQIGSIQTESDIQMRVMLDKIAKMEAQIHAGENVKKELQRAHTEARALVVARQDMIGQIEQLTQELEKNRADVDQLPQMHVELDGLRQEHQKLRSTFEFEKNLNMEKAAQMELMEKDLLAMAREVEKLRAEVSNVEKRPLAPNMYGGGYMNHEYPPPPPPRVHASGGGYVDGYGKQYHHVQTYGDVQTYGGGHAAPGVNPQWGGPPMIPYGGGGGGRPGPAAGAGSSSQWGGAPPYDSSYSRA